VNLCSREKAVCVVYNIRLRIPAVNTMVVRAFCALLLASLCLFHQAAVAWIPRHRQYLNISSPGYILDGYASAFAATDDMRLFAAYGRYTFKLNVYKLVDGSLHSSYEGHGANLTVRNLVFSSNGELVASFANSLRIYSVSKKLVLFDLKRETAEISSISKFFADDSSIAVGYSDGIVAIWDVRNGKKEKEFSVSPFAVESIAFHESRNILSFASDNQSAVFLVDLASSDGLKAEPVDQDCGHPRASQFHGNFLAFGCQNATIKVYDLDKKLVSFLLDHDLSGFSLDFADSALVSASYDASIRVWDLSNGNMTDTVPYDVLRNPIVGIATSKDGQLIAVCSRHLVQLWRRKPNDSSSTSSAKIGSEECLETS